MRYLSLFFASLLLVGCAQSTDVEPATQDVDTQSQRETTEPEDSGQSEETPSVAEEETEDEPVEQSESVETEASDSETNDSDASEPQPSEPATGENQAVDDETESSESAEEIAEEEAPEEVEEPQQEPAGFTMAMVSENDDASSCWSAINGNVYDLTDWAVPGEHPGGSQRILSLCGKDGSVSFNAMHQGQSNPESRLQSFLLGPLS